MGEYRQAPMVIPGRDVMAKVKCGKETESVRMSTEWSERVFKQRMAERYDIPKRAPVRVDMYDGEGRRQRELAMRNDWGYVVTSGPPEDGTELWRTKRVQIESPDGMQQLWVHPGCDREELTREIKAAKGLAQDEQWEAERTDGSRGDEVREGKSYRLVRVRTTETRKAQV
jgi:hypothetical protein